MALAATRHLPARVCSAASSTQPCAGFRSRVRSPACGGGSIRPPPQAAVPAYGGFAAYAARGGTPAPWRQEGSSRLRRHCNKARRQGWHPCQPRAHGRASMTRLGGNTMWAATIAHVAAGGGTVGEVLILSRRGKPEWLPALHGLPQPSITAHVQPPRTLFRRQIVAKNKIFWSADEMQKLRNRRRVEPPVK